MKDKKLERQEIKSAIVYDGKFYVDGRKIGRFTNTYYYIVCNADTGEILEENIFKKWFLSDFNKKNPQHKRYLEKTSWLIDLAVKYGLGDTEGLLLYESPFHI